MVVTPRRSVEETVAEISRLPGPVADRWEWQMMAGCRAVSPGVFFHPEGERGSARRNRDDHAKSICRDCPVVVECRMHALQVKEPYGVWGGMTEDERTLAGDNPMTVPA